MAMLTIGLAGQGAAPGTATRRSRRRRARRPRARAWPLKTLQIVGYGELAYFNGGGNITGDPAAPQKWQKVLDYTRTIDLEHGRTRVRAAAEDGLRVRVDDRAARAQSDQRDAGRRRRLQHRRRIPGGRRRPGRRSRSQPGPAAARQRRVEMLAHPITIVRAALDTSTRLSNLRKQGNLQLVDVTVPPGRYADAGGRRDIESARVGQLRRPEREPR